MRITVWIATRERRTWVAMAEALVIVLLLVVPLGPRLQLVLVLPLLGHLTWSAVTSIPAGAIPGRADGTEVRSNYHLRARVSSFLTDVQRAEKYVREARASGIPRSDLKKNLRWTDDRLRATVAEVVKALGRTDL